QAIPRRRLEARRQEAQAQHVDADAYEQRPDHGQTSLLRRNAALEPGSPAKRTGANQSRPPHQERPSAQRDRSPSSPRPGGALAFALTRSRGTCEGAAMFRESSLRGPLAAALLSASSWGIGCGSVDDGTEGT